MKLLKTTNLARSLRLQRLVRVALLGLFLGQLLTGPVRGAEDAADPYDVLYDVLMTRYGKDGKSYAENETSPAIFEWSEFPFDDKTFKEFDEALDEFAALPQEKIEQYSDVKRAVLQRHLWKVFDATFNWDWWQEKPEWGWGGRRYFPKTHMDCRKASQPKLVSLIRKLALPKEQILALPNPLAATVKSGGFATAHDPKDRFKPFLPADLYGKESSFVCVGEDRHEIPAAQHTGKLYARSMFVQFMRLPGGRTETLEYMARVKEKVEQFPVGTQFALLEQPYLISDEGEMILSPMIVSVQLRAYLDVGRRAREARPDATQCVAEFVLHPRELIKGNAVMRALTPKDFRYVAGSEFAAGFSPKDPFATGDITEGMPTVSRLNSCMGCHGGKPGVRTRSFRGTSFFFTESGPDEISKATVSAKQEYDTWKRLRELWQADAKNEDKQSAVPASQSNNKGKLEDRQPTESAVARSTFDELYDVLMVRHARNGVPYGENEIAPMIFKRSGFPFDDATYPRLTAALDALTPEDIKSYSVVQRAILQRQLWAVFDATIPSRFVIRRPHETRRAAVHKQLAGLIRQLALKRSEIESLPDTLQTTVEAKKYPVEFDINEPTSPFLPRDLTEDSSSWICFGRGSTPVNLHATDGRWRSAFFQFVRLPGGRQATIEYIDRWSKEKAFPAGTQVALIEKAFLVSDKGEMVLSPMTVSTQLRAYRNVEQSFRDAGTATQCVAEFISRPRDYLRGDSLMAAVSPTDHRLKTVRSDGGKQDVLELVNDPKTSVLPRLQQCVNCHGGAGTNSLGDVVAPRGTLKSLQRRSQKEIVQATAAAKQDDASWKLLQTSWARAHR